jgi:hypothetical protein
MRRSNNRSGQLSAAFYFYAQPGIGWRLHISKVAAKIRIASPSTPSRRLRNVRNATNWEWRHAMSLRRSDLDQALRYLQHARELLEREPLARMRATRGVLDLAVRRLSPGDFYVGDAAAEITVLRDIAGKVDGATRTDILKAVAILDPRL